MKIKTNILVQKGSGLVGILVALVVIAIGGLAITGLMGNLTLGTSESKARNEALELAREKTEELRNFIEKAKFDYDLTATALTGCPFVADPSNPINGVNANFLREWCICKVTKEGESPALDCPDDSSDETIVNMRKVIMRVSYVDPNDPVESDGTTEKRQNILLNNFITFSDPTKTGQLSIPEESETPRPSNSKVAIERAEDETTTPHSGEVADSGDGDTGTFDTIYKGVNSNNNLVIYVPSTSISVGDEITPTDIKLTVFGGALLEFRGQIYHDKGKAPLIRSTSATYCQTIPLDKTTAVGSGGCGLPNKSGLECARYVCFGGADCSQTTNGTAGCPTQDDEGNPIVASDPAEFGGGWYGRIGVFFPDIKAAGQIPTTCLGNSINNPARLYVTHRYNAGNLEGYEGINQTPFTCQNFFSTRLQGNLSDYSECGEAIDFHFEKYTLPDGEIIRVLNDDALNTVEAPQSVACEIEPKVSPNLGNLTPYADFSYSYVYETGGISVSFADESYDGDGSITAWSWDFGDATTSALQNPEHLYPTGLSKTFNVTLTVTDDGPDPKSDSITKVISLPNEPPTASFEYVIDGLTVDFTDTSTDSDGTIVSWSWDFGDSETSDVQNTSHTYAGDSAAPGESFTVHVRLEVTDNGGATIDSVQSIELTVPVL